MLLEYELHEADEDEDEHEATEVLHISYTEHEPYGHAHSQDEHDELDELQIQTDFREQHDLTEFLENQ
jgi:hypothetical protein